MACNDHVFYTISTEVEPKDPVIQGKPVNILVYNDALYTASGNNIYTYTSADKWQKADLQPGGMITHIAVSGPYLYALCESQIKRLANGVWEQLDKADETDYYAFRSIYGGGDAVFIGAEYRNSFRIYYIDENETDKEKAVKLLINNDSGELCGAASGGGWHYFITKEKGAYRTNDPGQGAKMIPGSDDLSFTGIINLEDNLGTIISITRNGSLYILSDSIADKGVSFDSDNLSTGALAVWRDPANPGFPVLLLAGRQNNLSSSSSTSFSYGYLELELDSNGIKGAEFREPGTQPSSIDNNDRFLSTIGKQPVNHILQTPYEIDPEMILFASTQKSGLWSYRVIDGTPQWNAEE